MCTSRPRALLVDPEDRGCYLVSPLARQGKWCCASCGDGDPERVTSLLLRPEIQSGKTNALKSPVPSKVVAPDRAQSGASPSAHRTDDDDRDLVRSGLADPLPGRSGLVPRLCAYAVAGFGFACLAFAAICMHLMFKASSERFGFKVSWRNAPPYRYKAFGAWCRSHGLNPATGRPQERISHGIGRCVASPRTGLTRAHGATKPAPSCVSLLVRRARTP